MKRRIAMVSFAILTVFGCGPGAVAPWLHRQPHVSLPMSTSQERPTSTEHTLIITRNSILWNASTPDVIVTLDEGREVAQEHLVGGMFITSLQQRLLEHSAVAAKTPEWNGQLLIAADHETPYGTLAQTLATAGAAGFREFFLITGEGERLSSSAAMADLQGVSTLTLLMPNEVLISSSEKEPHLCGYLGGPEVVGVGRSGGGTNFGGFGNTKIETQDPVEPRVESNMERPEPTVRGSGIKAKIIRKVILQHKRELKACYESTLLKDPERIEAQVDITFTINPQGKVASVGVDNLRGSPIELGTCITEAIIHWNFPAPKGGGSVEVSHSFFFWGDVLPVDPAPKALPVTEGPGEVSVMLNSEGFHVFLGVERIEPIAPDDWVTLYNTLLDLKGRYPTNAGCHRLVVTPMFSTPVGTLASLIDLAQHPLGDGQPISNRDALRKAEPNPTMMLFPEVVLRRPRR